MIAVFDYYFNSTKPSLDDLIGESVLIHFYLDREAFFYDVQRGDYEIDSTYMVENGCLYEVVENKNPSVVLV